MLFAHNLSRRILLICPQRSRHAALLLTCGLFGTSRLQAQNTPLATQAIVASGESNSASTFVQPLPEAPQVAVSEPPMAHTATANVDHFAAPTTGTVRAFPDFQQRERRFLSDLLGPTAFIASVFQAGIDTARPLKVGYPADGLVAPGQHPAHGDVPEWGEGAQGYAKRYADRFGQGLIGTTSRYALGEILRQDVTYHRCECTGLVPRTGHALASAYLARTRGGRRLPSLPALASPFIASEVAVSAWYPGRFTTSDALRGSVVNYIAAPFKNLFTEFLAK